MLEKLTTVYIKCRSCGDEFPFEPGQQKYFARNGLALPAHCPACILERKLAELRRRTIIAGEGGAK